MVNQSKAEDYFSKIPSIKRISGVHFFEGKASLTKLLHFPFYIKEINMIKSLIDFDLSSCFMIFGNYVSIFTIVGKPYGVLIENEYYRKTLDSIFENLWELSEKPIQ